MIDVAHKKSLSVFFAGALLLLSAVILIFWPSFSDLHHSWLDSSHLSHGYILLPLSLYFLWEKRFEFTHHAHRFSIISLLACIALSLMWFIAYSIDLKSIHNTLALFILIAVLYGALGTKLGNLICIPIGLMLFAAPIWGLSVPFLQNTTVLINNFLLSFIDIPAHMEGNYIKIASGTFFVAEGCSGYKYVITTVTLCVIFAYWNYAHWPKRILIVLLGLMLGMITNWIRVFSLIIIGEMTDMQSSLMHDHEWYGWILYGCMILPLLYFAHRWQTQTDAEHQKVNTTYHATLYTSLSRKTIIGFILTICAISIGPLLSCWQSSKNQNVTTPNLSLITPPSIHTQGLGPVNNIATVKSTFELADKHLHTTYILLGKTIDWELNFYFNQTQDKELINYKHFVADPQVWRFIDSHVETINIENTSIPLIISIMMNNVGEKRIAFLTYNIGGVFYSSKLKFKFAQIFQILKAKQYAYMLAANTTCQFDCSKAKQAVIELLKATLQETTHTIENSYSSTKP